MPDFSHGWFSLKKLLLTFTFIFTFFQFLLAQNFNMQFRGEVLFPYSCASIWGYTALDGALLREYALVGTDMGVSIVDVTDPDNPNDLFDVVHPGAEGEWREIKTWGHYAYATNETDNGLLIIDLQYLPGSVSQYQFIYDPAGPGIQTTGHTLWIDEQGRMFVFGGNYSQGYACFDLTVDPLHPPYIGEYSNYYIHDGFVRGDTLWAAEIFDGQVEVINVSDPSNPAPMALWTTPNNFSHNVWPTHDDHYAFTTDEVDNSYLASYDVSDLNNITELDRAQSNPGSNAIIHNVHLYNDQFGVVAYYKDGVVLFDVSRPDNMIECGSYDTDPNESGGGYGGTWGVYPYLPSGNIIASDLSDAGFTGGRLTVLTPSYVAACWLEGNITDSITNASLNNVSVQIISTNNSDNSDLSGNYKTGNGIAGTYTVQFVKSGYHVKQIENVTLSSGNVTSLDVQLSPLMAITLTGLVEDSLTGVPIPGAKVRYIGLSGVVYNTTTDANGNYSISGTDDKFTIYAGKWSYHETGLMNVQGSPLPVTIKLAQGYYDDFLFDFSWVSAGGVSSSGKWIRGEPIGTADGYDVYNADQDLTSDYGDQCFMTGNEGGQPGTSDVDDDTVKLTTPVFDLTSYNEPYINFFAWWVDGGIFGAPDDVLWFTLSNGNTTVSLLNLTSNASNPAWVFHSFRVSDFILPTSNMTMKLFTVDHQGNANWIEAGIDEFKVVDSLSTSIPSSQSNSKIISVYPNPFSDETIVSYRFDQLSDNARFDVYDLLGNKLESLPVKTTSGTVTLGRNLANGFYLIRLVEDERTSSIVKAVKEK